MGKYVEIIKEFESNSATRSSWVTERREGYVGGFWEREGGGDLLAQETVK